MDITSLPICKGRALSSCSLRKWLENDRLRYPVPACIEIYLDGGCDTLLFKSHDSDTGDATWLVPLLIAV